MITNDEELDVSVDQLRRMYRALASLKREVLPRNEPLYRVMAEGPLEEIRRLRESIEEYATAPPLRKTALSPFD